MKRTNNSCLVAPHRDPLRLSVTLAAVSLGQARAAALTAHTQTPKVNVRVPSPKVNVSPSPPNAVGRPRDAATGMATGKRQ
jgi:hypothetical protein